MAYRKHCGVAVLAVGLLAAGCGAGTARNATETVDDDQPSTSDEQPGPNPDRPSGSDEQPPSDSEQPGSNPDQPGGGTIGKIKKLCDDLCEAIDRCTSQGETPNQGMNLDALCSTGCEIPASAPVGNIPCLDELVDAFDCVADAGGLCPTAASASALAGCQSAGESFVECAGDIDVPEQPDDDDDDGPGPVEGTCSMANGCQTCANACDICNCIAGTNVDARAACAMGACMR